MRSRLRPGEEAVLVVRRHPIALAGPALVMLFLGGALAASLLAPQRAVLAVAAAVFTVALAWALWKHAEWRRDLWVVTTSRVIDESGVLTVRMVDSPLETINNVACEQTLCGRLFGFGKVTIQTAAPHGGLSLEGIAAPEALRDAIIDVQMRRRAAVAGAGVATQTTTRSGA
jgi:membrane protein YdbS with pleckstrin-like domain